MSRHRDSYENFASHYDLHGWDWYAPTYGPRLFRLLEERNLGNARVLDAGCGTGSLALEFAKRGHRVTGLDLSEAMLRVAQGKDPAETVRWVQGDITAFDLPAEDGPFDLITCVADILNHLETLEDWEKAFRHVARHLRPGGAFVLDVMTCLGLERLDRIAVEERKGRTLILAIVYEPAARRSTVKVTSFAPRPGTDLYERRSETITEWGQPVAGIFRRLESAGLGRVERPWAIQEDPEQEERLAALSWKV